ncbi:MAG: glycosyltransferase [Solirubrobacteraceae bacterium]
MARQPGRRVVSIQTTSERGGAEYANVDLLDALVERGRDAVLLTNLPDLADGTRVRVRELKLGPKLTRATALGVLARAPLALPRLVAALRAERPIGVLLLHFKKEQLLCSLLPRRLAPSIVWAEWGPVPVQMRRGLGRVAYALASRRVERVIAVSAGTSRSVIAAGVDPRKLLVVPNLLDVDAVAFDPEARASLRRAWGAGQSTMVIGCIARFQRRKRNDVVIDAMTHLDGDAMLVMAGEGEQEPALRERAAPHGDRVRFERNVRGHVEQFLSACDVLVFAPSPTEGEPRVIVMAQLVGVPVVATDTEGAEGLIVPGQGTIVSPSHDARALARALASYRDEPERRRREGAAGRTARRESHDRERTVLALEQALGTLPDRPAAASA